jgi:type III secretion protein Q
MSEIEGLSSGKANLAGAILPPHACRDSDVQAAVLARARVTSVESALTRAVGRGRYVTLAALDGVLSVHLAAEAECDWSASIVLAGADGPIQIADGARLMRAVSGLDFDQMPLTDDEPQKWLRAALLGRLAGTPFSYCQDLLRMSHRDLPNSVLLRLTLRTARHLLTTHARARPSTWLDFLANTAWLRQYLPLPAWLAWPTETAVLLARHTLPASSARRLQPGDIVLPEAPYFQPEGEGVIQLGGLALRVRYRPPRSMEIIAVEGNATAAELMGRADRRFSPNGDRTLGSDDKAMDRDDDEAFGADDDAGYPEEHREGAGAGHGADRADHATDPVAPARSPATTDSEGHLDMVPFALHFELGTVHMSLGDMRTLGPGAIVLLEGGTPASIAIVASGRTVGRGEAVDVDGELGIRITHWGAEC